MQEWTQDAAFVVVVTHGVRDIGRTTWSSAADAKRYMERLRQQGIPSDDIRLYRTRLVKPHFPDLWLTR